MTRQVVQRRRIKRVPQQGAKHATRVRDAKRGRRHVDLGARNGLCGVHHRGSISSWHVPSVLAGLTLGGKVVGRRRHQVVALRVGVVGIINNDIIRSILMVMGPDLCKQKGA